MKTLFFFITTLLVTSVLSAQSISEDRYEISFKVSNTAFNSVRGTLQGMTGNVDFNKDEPGKSIFDICLEAATINTGNNKRDEHLRTEDFFHVSVFPTICFQSESISKAANQYEVKGDLTMHGISKSVIIPFEYNKNKLQGELVIDRQAFEVGGNSLLVGDEVEIQIEFFINR